MFLLVVAIVLICFAFCIIFGTPTERKNNKAIERLAKENHEFTKKYINEKNGKDLIK